MKEITKNNMLIAMFDDPDWPNEYTDPDFIEDYIPSYDRFYEYLMPIVDKIETLQIYSKIQGGSFPVKCAILRNAKGNGNIVLITCGAINAKWVRVEKKNKKEAIWLAIVEFIKWYNEQTKEVPMK